MSKVELLPSQVAERLLGAWRLVSWEAFDSEGHMTYPLGRDAVGQLFYDQAGRMSAQLRSSLRAAVSWGSACLASLAASSTAKR